MDWTVEQILAFAPDTGTANRGKKLANTKKWQNLSMNERAVWGECKGSGSKPYQTAIDLNGPAFKCSCPVRKPPCKHVIGLLLNAVNKEDFTATEDFPEWLNTWIEGRDKRLTKKKEVEASPVLQKEEAEKRALLKEKKFKERVERMKSGLMDLEIRLKDIMREGLANLESKPFGYWQDLSARLVDDQVKGVSNMIKDIPLLIGQDRWIESVLMRFSSIYMLIQAFQKLDKLPKEYQKEVLTICGINIKKDELLSLEGVNDEWMVLGKTEGNTSDDNVSFRRVWLWGVSTGQPALILDFSFRGSGYERHYKVGSIFKGELVYYPSILPIRAIVRQQYPSSGNLKKLIGVNKFEDFQNYYTDSVKTNPWLLDYPCPLKQVTPIYKEDKFYLIDRERAIIPTNLEEDMIWKILAFSGGHPISIFGEWTGEFFVPLSASIGERFVNLN